MKVNLRLFGAVTIILSLILLLVSDSNSVKKEKLEVFENVVEVQMFLKNEHINAIEIEKEAKVLALRNEKQLIIDKINSNLNSTLKNKGEFIVSYAMEKNVDPYLATAIILHETGCSSNCSKLVKKCNNVGGQKTKGAQCPGSSYGKFNTLDNGIKAFINNLSKNYIDKGLTTPKQINTKYAENKAWHERINWYMNKIKNS